MSSSLADRLEEARRRRFVGRESERSLFQSAITAPELPFLVLNIFGPGGIGKTNLLRECARIAARQSVPTVRLDGRNIDATPEIFLAVLRNRLKLEEGEDLDAHLAGQGGRRVIFIDTAELLAPLEGWLQDTFLPQMPDNVLVVMAGRNPPSPRWRADLGWQAIMHTISLRNLSASESRAYLVRRQVPAAAHDAILRFTHGHPLALSLIADVFVERPDLEFRPEHVPDVVNALLELFVSEVSDSAYLDALEACALVRLTTEPLLGELLQLDDSHPCFEWLRGLSFIEGEPGGLFPHDLAREALIADLRWRNPERYAELHHRARAYYTGRLEQADQRRQRHLLADLIYLHRENPAVRSYFEWQSSGAVYTDPARAEDKGHILAMAERHEGPRAAELASFWFERQPHAFSMFRASASEPQGFLVMLALDRLEPAERERDPAVSAAWSFLRDKAPLRAGETATLFRFWMATESYQSVSPVQSRIFLNMVQHYLTTPGLAYTFVPCESPEFWSEMFAYADLQRLEDADFSLDGRRYGVYGHDWRIVPPAAWLSLLAQREMGATVQPTAAAAPAAMLVLSESDFAEAVRLALRDYAQPTSLAQNPLMRSRLVIERHAPAGSDRSTPETLKRMLLDAAESLQATPRQLKFYRALYHTYFQPAPTQEQAAELLDLPFGTYRRYLRSGIQHVTDALWSQEVGSTPFARFEVQEPAVQAIRSNQ